jgi:hypothetical protein
MSFSTDGAHNTTKYGLYAEIWVKLVTPAIPNSLVHSLLKADNEAD